MYLGYQFHHHPTAFVWLVVVVQFVWNLCKEKRVATNEVHVYVLATSMPRMVLDNLTDASDYWTMTDKVRANISDGHCSARVTVNPFNSNDCLAKSQ